MALCFLICIKVTIVDRLHFWKSKLADTMLLTSLVGALASAAAAPANVLFIVVDDLGFDDVGFRSHEIKTPTIDALAASGRVLTQ